ncbi:MAG: hypothetical protein ABIM50_09770, partial [Novosphingobium sp.]
MQLAGTPSEQLPDVLATGISDATYVFLSFSSRDPQGRDAEYIAWHSLDHRPEQYRLAALRNSIRLVSTPACRAARAAEAAPYDAVDHIMTYQFAGTASMPEFADLGAALDRGGRMAHRLPSVTYLTASRAGMLAAPRAVAGADVIPWRPALGVYVLIEQGDRSPEELLDAPEVAGIWWWQGSPDPSGMGKNCEGLQVTYCFLDEDPVACAE